MYKVRIEQIHCNMYKIITDAKDYTHESKHRLHPTIVIAPRFDLIIGALNTLDSLPETSEGVHDLLFRSWDRDKDDRDNTVSYSHAYTAIKTICDTLGIHCPGQIRLGKAVGQARKVPLYSQE